MRATYLHYENGKGYFNRGNIIKYVCRAGKKDNELKDLEKAADYLKREIEYIRNEQEKWIEKNK
jgi:hypothetical protein